MSVNIINGDPDFDTYICPVYMTDLEGDARTVNCGHTFSSRFIEEVYKKAIKECPLCRTPITHVSENNNYSLKEALGDVKALRKENIKIKEHNRNLVKENNKLKEKCHNQDLMINNLNNTLNKICEKFEKLDFECNKLQERNNELSQRITDGNTKYEELSKRFDDETIVLKQQIDADKQNYDDLSRRFDDETKSLKAQIAEKNRPIYYSSDSDSDSDDDYPPPRSTAIIKPVDRYAGMSCPKRTLHMIVDVLPF
ncbi:MAG: hypothetical protein V4494_06055 [Chlamydiota bacterium]